MKILGKIMVCICTLALCLYAAVQSLPVVNPVIVWNLAVMGIGVLLVFALFVCRKQCGRASKKVCVCLAAAALALAAMVSLTIFQNNPEMVRTKLEVTIVCGEKSETAKGKEVWITGYNVNGIKQPIETITVISNENVYFQEGQNCWLYNDVDQSGNGQITFAFDENIDDYELIFVQHAWSGIIEIMSSDGAEPITVDLSQEGSDRYLFKIPGRPLKPLEERIFLFAGFFLISAVALFPLLFAAWHIAATVCRGIKSVAGKKGKTFSIGSIDAVLMGVASMAIPFHYLLFLFTNNSAEILFSSLLTFAVAVAGMALIMYAVVYAATCHPFTAFIAGAMVSVLMFVTGYADEAVKGYCGDVQTAALTLCIVGGACALLLLLLLFIKHKETTEVRLSTILVSIVTVMLLIFNVPKALDINRQQRDNLGLQYIKTDYNIDSSIQDRPNIYWLHCDSMLGFDAYEKYYGDNQNEFAQELEDRGLVINRSAMFEGGHTTTVCLPSLLCPDFYDQYVTPRIVDGYLEREMDKPEGIALQSVASTMRANLELTNALREVGYTVALNTANWWGLYFADADELYESPDGIVLTRTIEKDIGGVKSANANGTEKFADQFVRPLKWAMESIDAGSEDTVVVARVDESKVNRPAGATLSVAYADPILSAKDGKQRLVFLPFNDAHTPFDINEDGEWITENNTNVRDYELAHRFSKKVVLTMIDTILEKDPDAVIVVQADHGLHGNTREDFVAAFGEDAQEKELWNCVISAIRVPEKYQNGEEFYAVANPLNMSRYLVNRFVGKNYEYLPANESLIH